MMSSSPLSFQPWVDGKHRSPPAGEPELGQLRVVFHWQAWKAQTLLQPHPLRQNARFPAPHRAGPGEQAVTPTSWRPLWGFPRPSRFGAGPWKVIQSEIGDEPWNGPAAPHQAPRACGNTSRIPELPQRRWRPPTGRRPDEANATSDQQPAVWVAAWRLSLQPRAGMPTASKSFCLQRQAQRPALPPPFLPHFVELGHWTLPAAQVLMKLQSEGYSHWALRPAHQAAALLDRRRSTAQGAPAPGRKPPGPPLPQRRPRPPPQARFHLRHCRLREAPP